MSAPCCAASAPVRKGWMACVSWEEADRYRKPGCRIQYEGTIYWVEIKK